MILNGKRTILISDWSGQEHNLEKQRSHTLIKNIHQELMRHLMPGQDHLESCSEDQNARNEAFWFRGGMDPDNKMIRKREGTQKMQKKMKERGWFSPGTEGKMT